MSKVEEELREGVAEPSRSRLPRRITLSPDIELFERLRDRRRTESIADEMAPDSLDRGGRIRRVLLLSDVLALSLATVFAMAFLPSEGPISAVAQVAVVALSLPLFVVIAHLSGLYHLVDRHIDHTLAEEVGPAFMTVTVWAFLVFMASSLVATDRLDAGWFGALWAVALVATLFGRQMVRRFTTRTQWYRQRVLVVGDPVGITRVVRRIRRHPEVGLDLAGSIYRTGGGLRAYGFDAEGDRHDQGFRPTDRPRDVLALVREAQVARVMVTGWAEDLDERTELIRLLATCGVYVDIVSGEPEALLAGASMHHLEGLPIMTVRPPRITHVGRAVKRLIDISASSLGLLILSPVLAYVSLRIKLDSRGPVFFRQKRVGFNGRYFEIVKFRTMVTNAEEMKASLRDESHDGNVFKLRDDPRVTSFGGTIRKTSLDELPQLWNVLKGDMSLVGPRPLPPDEAPLASHHFARRQNVRPGITGPWQIHGRSDIPFEDMIKLDYTYVSTWSLQEDLRLLIRTIGVVLGGRGAY